MTWFRLVLAVMGFASLFVKADALPAPSHVSPHAWAWIVGANTGFVVGRDAVAVIDTGSTPQMAEEMVVAIRKVTPLPIRYAINTNSQPSRSHGNDVFRKHGARVIAAADAATSTARLNLGGGVALEIMNVGLAQSRGSLLVRAMPDRVVYAGDVLGSGRLPALLPESSITGWIAAYERLRGIDALILVPGHGQPAVLAKFEEPTFAYLQALKTHMDAAFKAGKDSATAASTFDASRWKKLAHFTELSGPNASHAYLESTKN